MPLVTVPGARCCNLSSPGCTAGRVPDPALPRTRTQGRLAVAHLVARLQGVSPGRSIASAAVGWLGPAAAAHRARRTDCVAPDQEDRNAWIDRSRNGAGRRWRVARGPTAGSRRGPGSLERAAGAAGVGAPQPLPA